MIAVVILQLHSRSHSILQCFFSYHTRSRDMCYYFLLYPSTIMPAITHRLQPARPYMQSFL